MRTLDLHTVCESARCPNMGECWEHRTATFMILGNICTRACGFCAVPSGKPLGPPEEDEPERVAEAVERMGLRYAVVTSVNRDDQPDGGAAIFARASIYADSRTRSRMQSRSADPGFSRRLVRTRNGDGGASRRAESQYGNRAAPLPPCAQRRGVRALARTAAPRERNGARPADKNWNDAGSWRNAPRSARRDGRNRRAGHSHPHARANICSQLPSICPSNASSTPTNSPSSNVLAKRWASSTLKQAR